MVVEERQAHALPRLARLRPRPHLQPLGLLDDSLCHLGVAVPHADRHNPRKGLRERRRGGGRGGQHRLRWRASTHTRRPSCTTADAHPGRRGVFHIHSAPRARPHPPPPHTHAHTPNSATYVKVAAPLLVKQVLHLAVHDHHCVASARTGKGGGRRGAARVGGWSRVRERANALARRRGRDARGASLVAPMGRQRPPLHHHHRRRNGIQRHHHTWVLKVVEQGCSNVRGGGAGGRAAGGDGRRRRRCERAPHGRGPHRSSSPPTWAQKLLAQAQHLVLGGPLVGRGLVAERRKRWCCLRRGPSRAYHPFWVP